MRINTIVAVLLLLLRDVSDSSFRLAGHSTGPKLKKGLKLGILFDGCPSFAHLKKYTILHQRTE